MKQVNQSNTALDQMINQNEDLQARLNMSLKKIAQLENHNQNIENNLKKFEVERQSFNDRLNLLREKETILRSKLKEFDEIKLTNSNLQISIDEKNRQIDRYKKYADKMQNQVRPYIKNLKDYISSLIFQNESQTQQIASFDQKIKNLQVDLERAHEQLMIQKIQNEQNQVQFVNQWQTEKENHLMEIEYLKNKSSELETKVQRLDQTLAREDELENLVISLNREIKNKTIKQNEELEKQTLLIQELRAARIDNSIEIESLKENLKNSILQTSQSELILSELQKQNAEFKNIIKEKTDEITSLKQNHGSLEKLNHELNSRLATLRDTSL